MTLIFKALSTEQTVTTVIYLSEIKGGANVKIFFVLRQTGAQIMRTHTNLTEESIHMQYRSICYASITQQICPFLDKCLFTLSFSKISL